MITYVKVGFNINKRRLVNWKIIKSVKKLKENSHFIKEAKKIIYPKYTVKNGLDGLAHIEHVTHIGMKIADRECDEADTDLLGITLGCMLFEIKTDIATLIKITKKNLPKHLTNQQKRCKVYKHYTFLLCEKEK